MTGQSLKAVLRRGVMILLFMTPLLFFPLMYDRYNAVKESFVYMVLAAILLLCAIFLWTSKQKKIFLTSLEAPFFVFLLASFVLLLFSTNPSAGIERWFWFCALFMLCTISHTVFSEKNYIIHALVAVQISGFLVSVYGLFLFFIHQKWFVSTLGHPNFVSQYLLFVMSSSLALIFLPSDSLKNFRAFFVLCFFLSYFSFLLTLVKGAWTGFAAALVFVAFLLARHSEKIKLCKDALRWGAVLLTGVIFLTALSFGTPAPSLKRPLTPAGELKTFSNLQSPGIRARLTFYKDTLRMLRDVLPLGIGLDNFAFVYPRYRTLDERVHSYDERLTRVHNDYLQILAETGLLGFMAFLWFMLIYLKKFSLYFRSGKMPGEPDHPVLLIALFTGIAATLVQSLFDFNFYNPASSLYFFVFLGSSLSLLSFAQDKDAHPSRKTFTLNAAGALVVSAGALLFVFLFSFTSVKTSLCEYWKKQGYLAYRQNAYNAANRDFLSAQKVNPYDFEAYALAGENAFVSGNYPEALTFTNRALILSPNDYQLFNFRGRIYFASKDSLKSYQDFEKALSIYDFSLPHYNLGLLYEWYGDIGKALQEYKLSAERNPSYSPAYYKLGILYGMAGFHAKALSYFQKAQGGFADDAAFHFNLALALKENRRSKEAEDVLEKAIALSPQNKTYVALAAQWKKDGVVAHLSHKEESKAKTGSYGQ